MSRHALLARALFACAWTLAACSAVRAANVPHLDLSVDLEPDSRHFSAVARFETALRELRVRLHRSLVIRSVTVDDTRVGFAAPAASGNDAIWVIPLPETGKVAITYSGALPVLDRNLDHRGVLRIGAPMASTEGSFLPAGSHWHPGPRDSYTYRVALTLPGTQRGLVAGDLVEETLPTASDAHYRAVFEMKQPSEGIDLMAGPYAIEERRMARTGGEPLRLRTYFTAPVRELASAYLDDSARYVAMYSQAIGAYPYGAFSVVSSPLPTGFGMPTLTYLGADVLKLPFIRASSLGHEVLHNWWGNGVHPDYATGNWSEGLTTFMADYAYKERESAAAARDMRLAWMRDLAAIPPEARLSLAQFRSRTHGAEAAAGYGKAAMVFFMLRDLIGEDAWSRGIRLFWEQHRFRRASWQDLQRAFERASGRPLQAFFDQWVRRADAPQIAIADASAAPAGNGYRLTVAVAQQGRPYALQVPLAVTVGGRVETHVVAVDGARTSARLDVGAKPESVRLDPELRVWRELQARELPPILRLWIVARAPQYVVATSGARVDALAAKLARRLFETPPQRAAESGPTGSEPLLIVGLQPDVDAWLARAGLPPRPAMPDAQATAWVWTIPELPQRQRPVAVVSARDAQSLEALLRPLPHYGAQSYLVFDGAKAVARGVWPVAAPAVPVAVR